MTENGSGWWPVDNLLLVQPKRSEIEERAARAGLKLSDGAADRERGAVTMGTVIATGPGPWKRWDKDDAPQPGDEIVFKRYAWACLDETMSADSRRYWVLQEDDIFLVKKQHGLKSAEVREIALDKEGERSDAAA